MATLVTTPAIRELISPATQATTTPSFTTSGSTVSGDHAFFEVWTPVTSGVIPTHTINATFSSNGGVEVLSRSHNDGTTDGRQTIYRISLAGASASHTVCTVSGTGSGTSYTGGIVFQVNTYDVTGIVTNSVTSTGTGLIDPGSVAAPKNSIVMAWAAWHMASAADNSTTPPTGYTEQWEISGSAAHDISLATKTISTAATENPGTFGDGVTPNGSGSITVCLPGYSSFVPGIPTSAAELDAAMGSGYGNWTSGIVGGYRFTGTTTPIAAEYGTIGSLDNTDYGYNEPDHAVAGVFGPSPEAMWLQEGSESGVGNPIAGVAGNSDTDHLASGVAIYTGDTSAHNTSTLLSGYYCTANQSKFEVYLSNGELIASCTSAFSGGMEGGGVGVEIPADKPFAWLYAWDQSANTLYWGFRTLDGEVSGSTSAVPGVTISGMDTNANFVVAETVTTTSSPGVGVIVDASYIARSSTAANGLLSTTDIDAALTNLVNYIAYNRGPYPKTASEMDTATTLGNWNGADSGGFLLGEWFGRTAEYGQVYNGPSYSLDLFDSGETFHEQGPLPTGYGLRVTASTPITGSSPTISGTETVMQAGVAEFSGSTGNIVLAAFYQYQVELISGQLRLMSTETSQSITLATSVPMDSPFVWFAKVDVPNNTALFGYRTMDGTLVQTGSSASFTSDVGGGGLLQVGGPSGTTGNRTALVGAYYWSVDNGAGSDITTTTHVGELLQSFAGYMGGVVAISGTASVTLAALTSSAAGVNVTHGAAAPTLGALASSAAGAVQIKGAASPTLDAVTSSATGENDTHGAAAITLGAVTTSAAGTVQIKGAAAPTLGDVTCSGVIQGSNQGAATITLAALTSSAAGVNVTHGAAAPTLGALTSSAAGVNVTHGAAAITLAALAVSAAGENDTHGAAAPTLAALTSSAAGVVQIKGTAAITLGALLGSGAGSLPLVGAGSGTLAPLTVSATGAARVQGASAPTLDALMATAAGVNVTHGAAAITLGALTTSSAGEVDTHGTAAITLGALTSAAAGTITTFGAGAATLGDATAAAAGEVVTHGTTAATLDALTSSADGTVGSGARLDVTLDAVTSSAAGTVLVTGAGARTLGAVTASAAGGVQTHGELARTLDNASTISAGVVPIAGALGQQLAGMTTQASGSVRTYGALNRALDSLRATITAIRIDASDVLSRVMVRVRSSLVSVALHSDPVTVKTRAGGEAAEIRVHVRGGS